MRIAFTTCGDSLQAAFEPHITRASHILLYDRSSRTFKTLPGCQPANQNQQAGAQLAHALQRIGVDTLVTGHGDAQAVQQLKSEGIDVCELEATTVADAFNQFNALHASV
ncbi:hypothetical protein KQI52_09400 [bacterium]|nr:hypothetical protein [bacterium]